MNNMNHTFPLKLLETIIVPFDTLDALHKEPFFVNILGPCHYRVDWVTISVTPEIVVYLDKHKLLWDFNAAAEEPEVVTYLRKILSLEPSYNYELYKLDPEYSYPKPVPGPIPILKCKKNILHNRIKKGGLYYEKKLLF